MEKKEIEKYYHVTLFGEVLKKLKSGRLKPVPGTITKDGYNRHTLTVNGNTFKILTHRLVLMFHLPNNDPDKVKVIHLDHDKLNNDVSNLKWVTNKEAMAHQLKKYPDLPQSSRKNKTVEV